jgi:hypothetical protein
MAEMDRYEQKVNDRIPDFVDWGQVQHHIDNIIAVCTKTVERKLDFTGNIRFHNGHLAKIFAAARDKAEDAILNEDPFNEKED